MCIRDSLTIEKNHGSLFAPEGADAAAETIFFITSTGISRSENSLTDLLVRINDKNSAEARAIYSSVKRLKYSFL